MVCGVPEALVWTIRPHVSLLDTLVVGLPPTAWLQVVTYLLRLYSCSWLVSQPAVAEEAGDEEEPEPSRSRLSGRLRTRQVCP